MNGIVWNANMCGRVGGKGGREVGREERNEVE